MQGVEWSACRGPAIFLPLEDLAPDTTERRRGGSRRSTPARIASVQAREPRNSVAAGRLSGRVLSPQLGCAPGLLGVLATWRRALCAQGQAAGRRSVLTTWHLLPAPAAAGASGGGWLPSVAGSPPAAPHLLLCRPHQNWYIQPPPCARSSLHPLWRGCSSSLPSVARPARVATASPAPTCPPRPRRPKSFGSLPPCLTRR